MKPNLRVILYTVAAVLSFILWQRWQLANAPQVPQQQQQAAGVPSAGIAAAVPNAGSAAQNAQLVHVQTDMYDIAISTEGASLISADLRHYPVSLQDKSPLPLVHEANPNRMIINSGIVTTGNPSDSATHVAKWQAAKTNYKLADGENTLSVPFTYTDSNGVIFTKTYIFSRGSYQFNLEESVNNQGTKPWNGVSYAQLNFGEGQSPGGLGHIATFTGAVMSTPDKHYDRIKLSSIAETGNAEQILAKTDTGWVAMMQHYFIGALIPEQGKPNEFYSRYNEAKGDHIIGSKTPMMTVAAGESAVVLKTTAYVGPKIAKNLEAAAPYLDKTVDYGWLFIISAIMFKVMAFIHSILGNWGWAIVIMTLLIKLIFFVPSAWAYKSMAKMRALQPEMTRLRERFGDDRAAMSREMMALYKKEKVNPASGCLPMLLQIPFFIAFYYMLVETVQLRQAPWLLWVHDLSVMDPYYILPIINAALMFLQQRLNPPPADPMQQKVMMLLPLVFGFMFLWFPAGLVLYWTVSNGFGIVQQFIMNKRYGSPAQAHKK